MISVEEALDLVDQHVERSEAAFVPMGEALGLILAEDCHSPIQMPPFNQSAMDGYAVHLDDTNDTYEVIGEVQAGSSEEPVLQKGQAVRIFTGAAVPKTATTVIRQEDIARIDDQISFTDAKVGQNIRPAGEQIHKGEVALKKGTEINPAAIGFLSTLGITEIKVYPKPKVAILSTGNELVQPGVELKYGQIYESNATMLQSAFEFFGFRDTSTAKIKDDYKNTLSTLKSTIAENDLIIISGGISVGDYDFVGDALRELGVNEIFYKVKQKPGKPLFFGKKENKLIFALPGNPAAALTGFYVYLLPTLNKLTGGMFEGCSKIELPIDRDYKKKSNRTEFLKAIATETEVKILEGQSSAMLGSFSKANALVVIHEEQEEVVKGEFVVTLLL